MKTYSSSVLALGGFLLVVIGIYFIFFRPALLPEDFQYLRTNESVIHEKIPQIENWLQKVFWVMGLTFLPQDYSQFILHSLLLEQEQTEHLASC